MRLALYAHYSEREGVAGYVLHYLRQLRELGFQICFISNSQIPGEKERQLRELCEKVIQRENTGFDFAMWQRALLEYEPGQFEELLLTNSSVVGPFYPLEPLWRRAAERECDFWGMTDSDELVRHLQSYFVLIRRPVLRHPCFQTFWRSILPFRDKRIVIGNYEIGLTKWLEEHGFAWSAVFPQKEIHALLLSRRTLAERLRDQLRPARLPQNTTMLLPDLLLECGMPFLKVQVLEDGGAVWARADSALRRMVTSRVPPEVLDELRTAAD